MPVVLYLEDMADTLENNAAILEEHGFEVLRCLTPSSAIAAMQGVPRPDVALLDINMEHAGADEQNIDGIQVAIQILQHRRIPIIFLSAFGGIVGYQARIEREIRPFTFCMLEDKRFDFDSMPERIRQVTASFWGMNAYQPDDEVTPATGGRILVNYADQIQHFHEGKANIAGYRRMVLKSSDIYCIKADGQHTRITTKASLAFAELRPADKPPYPKPKYMRVLVNKGEIEAALQTALGESFKDTFFVSHSRIINIHAIVGLTSTYVYLGESGMIETEVSINDSEYRQIRHLLLRR